MAENWSNEKLNEMLKGDYPYYRTGECDCDGRCCNFIILDSFHNKQEYSEVSDERKDAADEYWLAHGGEIVQDKWIPEMQHFFLPIPCNHNTACGKCAVFEGEKFPPQCGQFPVSPFDGVYRLLMQRGNPCGFKFRRRDNDKPWNMRIKRKNLDKYMP